MAAFPTIATPSLAHPWLPAAWPRLTAPGSSLETAVPPLRHPALPGGETPRQRRPGVVLLEQQDLAASPGPSASRLPPATQARGANRLSSIWSAWTPPALASPPAPLRPPPPPLRHLPDQSGRSHHGVERLPRQSSPTTRQTAREEIARPYRIRSLRRFSTFPRPASLHRRPQGSGTFRPAGLGGISHP